MDINIIPSILKVYVKDQEKDIDIKTIEKLLNIICKWNHNYFNDKIIDAPTCQVKIFTNTGVDEYFMRGKFPETYKEFRRIVGEIYE